MDNGGIYTACVQPNMMAKHDGQIQYMGFPTGRNVWHCYEINRTGDCFVRASILKNPKIRRVL